MNMFSDLFCFIKRKFLAWYINSMQFLISTTVKKGNISKQLQSLSQFTNIYIIRFSHLQVICEFNCKIYQILNDL